VPVAVSRSSVERVSIVRAALTDDLDSINLVQRAVGRAAYPPEAIEAVMNDPTRLLVVGVIDRCVAGWAKTHYWHRSEGDAPAGHYLGGVTVYPVFRRLGLGEALTEARLEWIWQRASVGPANACPRRPRGRKSDAGRPEGGRRRPATGPRK
jgi:GNAT superfamily N-acetyltransferase